MTITASPGVKTTCVRCHRYLQHLGPQRLARSVMLQVRAGDERGSIARRCESRSYIPLSGASAVAVASEKALEPRRRRCHVEPPNEQSVLHTRIHTTFAHNNSQRLAKLGARGN
jgi:hypothetical protein